MANIRLKELIEANVDPKLVARSKESGKLVYFKTPQAKDAALKAGSHIDPKAKKGTQPKADAKPNSMFGADYKKDRGAEAPKANGMATVNSIAAKTGMRAQAVAGWADENGVNLSKVSADIDSKKLNPKDFMTAVVGNPGNKYSKDIIAKYSQSSDSGDWMNDLDSIDVSDVKGKADPNADSFTSGDLYGATFKDPQTGKTITVGDAYEREDDSEAYKKAFAYVSKFDPDKEAVMGTQAYDDLNKKEAPKANLPKKASQLNYKHAESLENVVNDATGLNGYVDTDDNSDAIQYHGSNGAYPTYTLYFGGNSDYDKPDEFRVTLEPTYDNDPAKLSGTVDKTFKSGDDAMKFMIAVAKKYKKELQMDDDDKNESTKLTSMFKK